jgi:ankyrin repeat protein
MERLIDKGANVNLRSFLGINLLMTAASWGCEEIVKMLIRKGIDTSLKDKNGRNALMHIPNNGKEYPDIAEAIKWGRLAMLVGQDAKEAFKVQFGECAQ